jgi:hypothetical protein
MCDPSVLCGSGSGVLAAGPWFPAARHWVGLLVAVLACLAIVVAAVAMCEPRRSRWIGALTLVVVADAVIGPVLVLTRNPGPTDTWGLPVLTALVVPAVAAAILAADQWPMRAFRALVVVLGVVGVLGAIHIGRWAVAEQRAHAAYVDVTTQDRRLADILPAAGPKSTVEGGQAAVTAACTAARGVMGPDPTADGFDSCTPTPARPVTTVQDRAAYRLAADDADVAIGRVAVQAGRPGAESQLSAAQARLAADTVVADRPRDPDVGALEALSATGAALGAGLLPSGSVPPLRPDLFFWIAVLVVAVLAYRLLEVRNAGIDPGPVEVEDVQGGAAAAAPPVGKDVVAGVPKGDPHTAVLKHHLLKNVPEPGSVPGGEASRSVTDLVGLDPVAGRVLTILVPLVRAVGLPRRGFVVRTSVIAVPLPPSAQTGVSRPGPTEWEVSIRVLSARTQRPLHLWTTRNGDVVQGLAEAGYAAAAWIGGASRGVPPWLRWLPDAAPAFREFTRRSEDPSPVGEKDREERIDSLKRVLQSAPLSGQTLVLLGNEHDLAGRTLEALEYYRRAVDAHPGYSLARYRLGVSLAMAAGAAKDPCHGRRLAVLAGVDVAAANRSAATSADIRRAADRTLRSVSRSMWLLPWRRLSVHERSALPPLREWFGLVPVSVSARGPVQARMDPPRGVVRLQRRLRDGILDLLVIRRGSSWQLSYNRACTEAVLAARSNGTSSRTHVERAFCHLERAVLRAGSEQLSAAWLEKDADLKCLQTTAGDRARFARITGSVRP